MNSGHLHTNCSWRFHALHKTFSHHDY
uniref:Uncharacterized protein n=1 Tax=Arundo donax TaxID=35708 RepID=A0A0A8Y8A0_ARUDO